METRGLPQLQPYLEVGMYYVSLFEATGVQFPTLIYRKDPSTAPVASIRRPSMLQRNPLLQGPISAFMGAFV